MTHSGHNPQKTPWWFDILCVVLFVIILLLVTNAYSQEPERRNCIETWAHIQVGVREATGKNDGFEVEKYLASCNLDKGYSWCACFVNAGLKHCNISPLPDCPAWSPCWHKSEQIVWTQGDNIDRLKKGMVFGLFYRSKGRIAHTGLVLYVDDESIITIEGNTNVAGGRDGSGVHIRKRSPKELHIVSDWIKGAEDPGYFSHFVKKKETLYRIAINYGVTVNNIKKWNDLWNNNLYIGQELLIYS